MTPDNTPISDDSERYNASERVQAYIRQDRLSELKDLSKEIDLKSLKVKLFQQSICRVDGNQLNIATCGSSIAFAAQYGSIDCFMMLIKDLELNPFQLCFSQYLDNYPEDGIHRLDILGYQESAIEIFLKRHPAPAFTQNDKILRVIRAVIDPSKQPFTDQTNCNRLLRHIIKAGDIDLFLQCTTNEWPVTLYDYINALFGDRYATWDVTSLFTDIIPHAIDAEGYTISFALPHMAFNTYLNPKQSLYMNTVIQAAAELQWPIMTKYKNLDLYLKELAQKLAPVIIKKLKTSSHPVHKIEKTKTVFLENELFDCPEQSCKIATKL